MNNPASEEDDMDMDFDQSRQAQEHDLENILKDLEGTRPQPFQRSYTIEETIRIKSEQSQQIYHMQNNQYLDHTIKAAAQHHVEQPEYAGYGPNLGLTKKSSHKKIGRNSQPEKELNQSNSSSAILNSMNDSFASNASQKYVASYMKHTKSSVVKEKKVLEQEAEQIVKKRNQDKKKLKGSIIQIDTEDITNVQPQISSRNTANNMFNEDRQSIGKPQTQNYMLPKGRNSNEKKEYNNFAGEDIKDQLRTLEQQFKSLESQNKRDMSNMMHMMNQLYISRKDERLNNQQNSQNIVDKVNAKMDLIILNQSQNRVNQQIDEAVYELKSEIQHLKTSIRKDLQSISSNFDDQLNDICVDFNSKLSQNQNQIKRYLTKKPSRRIYVVSSAQEMPSFEEKIETPKVQIIEAKSPLRQSPVRKPVFNLPESPKLPPKRPEPSFDKLKQLESLLQSNPDVNRQSMGGGEILRMILMESKQYQIDNSDPVRPKTGMQARDISEIDSLIFADEDDRQQQQQDPENDSEEYSPLDEYIQRPQQRRKTWKDKSKSSFIDEDDVFEKALREQKHQEKQEEEDPIMKLLQENPDLRQSVTKTLRKSMLGLKKEVNSSPLVEEEEDDEDDPMLQLLNNKPQKQVKFERQEEDDLILQLLNNPNLRTSIDFKRLKEGLKNNQNR